MPDVWFAIPGDPATLTGGYVYARHLTAALPATGWFVHSLRLPASFPFPTAADLQTTADIFGQLPEGALVLADGLAFGALPRALLEDAVENRDLNVVALVHHPLAEESGLEATAAARLKESERAALAFANAVVVTSPHTAETLARDYQVAPGRLYVALPGTDRVPRAQTTHAVPQLLTVATLTYRKGHDVLLEALALIADLPWTSVWVGSADRDPAVTRNLQSLIKKHGLADRIILRGPLLSDALEAVYAQADAFVLPSRHEGYGMVFAEALARGLPIVACAAGAVRETVPADAGILVPVDDVNALAQALRRILTDDGCRKGLSDAAWRHGQSLPTWNDTAAEVAEALWAALP